MATDIGRLYAIIGADTSQFNRKMAGIGKQCSAVGKKMTMMLTLPILALGVAAVKSGADFEYAMTNAWAVTGEGEEALTAMTAKAREMGATTIFSAKQAGDAMYYMASAGWNSKKMAEAIQPTLDLAAATQSDLAFATEAVISSMNQFQISTKDTGRVTNVFAAAIMGSQATLEKLKISMTYIGPMAHSLGYEIEGTTAALMGLYNAGYEASTAGTALRMALAKLALGTGKTKEGLAALGLSVGDVNPEMVSLTEIVRKLEERGATATDVIKIFGVRAGPAMASLIAQGADALDEFEKKITGTESAAEMAEKQIKTFKGSFKLLTSIINEACIQIFEVLGPIIKDLVDNKIRPAVKAFTELSDAKKKTILKILGLVAAAGPLLMIFGKLCVLVPFLVGKVMLLGKALIFLATNPVGLCITALAIFATYIYKVVDAQKQLKESTAAAEEQTKKLKDKLNDIRKAAGVTGEEFGVLVNKYKGNYIALMLAIKAGKEGVELQKAMTEFGKKRQEQIGKETEGQDELTESIEDTKKKMEDMRAEIELAIEKENEATDATKAWQERLKELGVEVIPEMEEKIATLTEEIGKLDEMFKTGDIGVTDYFNAIKELKDEIDRLKTKIEETLPPARELNDVWELMKPPTEKFEEAAISLETMTQVFNTAVQDMGTALMDWGNMTGNILKNVGKIFGSFIQEMIKGFGKLVVAQMIQAKKSIIMEKATTIATAIAKVFKKIPFPLNIVIAGTMFGIVSALFAKIAKFGKGADVWKPTLAVVGEEGPEVVRRRSDYMRELSQARAQGESGAGGRRIMHLHQTIKIGEETFKKKITKIVIEEGELGNITFPSKVIK